MDQSRSAEVLADLEKIIGQAGVMRPRQVDRYDAGQLFDFEVTGVAQPARARARLVAEKFIGGGFAGQVYRVKLVALEPLNNTPGPDAAAGNTRPATIPGLEVGRTYALKILVPPSNFSLAFRNSVFAVAYQGPFAMQVLPAAARTGVLWQALIARAAEIEFGRPGVVCQTYATFYDDGLGSCGEINEWVEGRNWRFELDEHYFERRRFQVGGRIGVGLAPEEKAVAGLPSLPGGEPDFTKTGSPEYYAKKYFMARLVGLLHRLGAPELARQYEWWTSKSQPNVLKRADVGTGPGDGLTAIDFRAGLALLPFLPMSPADFVLICRGLGRGSLVQFDRGNLRQLEAYVNAHADRFADLRPALEELKSADPAYRRSLLDLTHHGLRFLRDGDHRRAVADCFVRSWQAAHLLDDEHADRLRQRPALFVAFRLLGFVPILIAAAALGVIGWTVGELHRFHQEAATSYWATIQNHAALLLLPLAAIVLAMLVGRLARGLRHYWGNGQYRAHLAAQLSSWDYLVRSLHARQAEILKSWARQERRRPEALVALATKAWAFWPQKFSCAFLPALWHRALMEPRYGFDLLAANVLGAWRFLRNAEYRRQWLETIIDDSHRDGILTEHEYQELRPKAADPYIKTYLLCVAGHMATLPATEIGSVVIALFWWHYNPDRSWQDAMIFAAGTAVLFQFTPISPASVCRGIFTVSMALYKWNLRDFKVAIVISFWKYIGYLAFPIQMASKYPVLARLMAGRWARALVGHVPVFGEHGALLEHSLLDTFFNLPISLRRRIDDGRETTFRLASKIILAAEWFILSLASAVSAWYAVRGLGNAMAPDATAAGNLLRACLTTHTQIFILAAMALWPLAWWICLAPAMARVRRYWLLLFLLTMASPAIILLAACR